jgi:hypothetical protein
LETKSCLDLLDMASPPPSPPVPYEGDGVTPSPRASNLRSHYEEEIDRLSQKVTTRLSKEKEEQVYKSSNMLQLKELYDRIKEISELSDLKVRIENILKEHEELSKSITEEYGIGFLKPRKEPNSRKMRKSRKRRKTKKTRK